MAISPRNGTWLLVVIGTLIFGGVQCSRVQQLEGELARAAQTGDERARERFIRQLREGREEIVEAGRWLDGFFASEQGFRRPEGLLLDGRPDFENITTWLLNLYVVERVRGASDPQARQQVERVIQSTPEWQALHPGG